MSFDPDPDDQHFLESMHLHRRHLSEEQMRRYEGYMAEIFTAFGLDLNTSATRETPQRYVLGNFVTTLDGVVTLNIPGQAGRLVASIRTISW